MAKQVTYANPPKHCDLCQAKITSEFYDFKTSFGPWGNGCKSCFTNQRGKLGTGFGQHYRLDPAFNKYVKVAG